MRVHQAAALQDWKKRVPCSEVSRRARVLKRGTRWGNRAWANIVHSSCVSDCESTASHGQGELERLGDVDEPVDNDAAFWHKKTRQLLIPSVHPDVLSDRHPTLLSSRRCIAFKDPSPPRLVSGNLGQPDAEYGAPRGATSAASNRLNDN